LFLGWNKYSIARFLKLQWASFPWLAQSPPLVSGKCERRVSLRLAIWHETAFEQVVRGT
jgi:hypothetical protein